MFARKSISPQGRHVLITGASSGLGRAAALTLADRGFGVFAAVRNIDDGKKLAADCPSSRIEPVKIDVTDDRSIDEASAFIAGAVGERGLWGLVNNAGICVSAPLECVSSRLFRQQLEINLVGQLAVTQAFLPALRRARGARIVNVTSGLGTVAIPYLGAYSAAQFAKESLSDALRRELEPMGVKVSVVSPGAIWTPIWGKVSEEGERALAAAPDHIADLYRSTFLNFLKGNEAGARASKTMPADVANAIHTALTVARPRTRYRVGADVRRGFLLTWLLPDTVIDGMFRQIVTPAPTPKGGTHNVRKEA